MTPTGNNSRHKSKTGERLDEEWRETGRRLEEGIAVIGNAFGFIEPLVWPAFRQTLLM